MTKKQKREAIVKRLWELHVLGIPFNSTGHDPYKWSITLLTAKYFDLGFTKEQLKEDFKNYMEQMKAG